MKENAHGGAGTGLAAQTISTNTSTTSVEGELQLAMESEHQGEVVEMAQAMELSLSTLEELGTAVASTPTPITDHIYSATVSVPTPIPFLTTVSSSMATPGPIYSMDTTIAPVPSTLMPICDAISERLR